MIYDISPVLAEDTAVWPGDVSLSRVWQCQVSEGSHLDLSSLSTTVHIGAHADAPSHYAGGAPTIDEVALEAYLGPCVVVTVPHTGLITREFCLSVLNQAPERILFKTGSQPDPKVFNEDFSAFAADAVQVMGEAGVKLIGIDTASVDPFDSKTLSAHHMLLRYGIRNLEGLDLAEVPDGHYELIALPLKLKGFDASPVRAILRK